MTNKNDKIYLGSDMMGSEDMDGMVYRDEDGNIVMYGD
jgi:hypothetical protein